MNMAEKGGKTLSRSFLQAKKRKYMIFFSLAVLFLIIVSVMFILKNQAAVGQAGGALIGEQEQVGFWSWITSFSFQVLQRLAVTAVVALIILGVVYGQKYRKLKSEMISKNVSDRTLALLSRWANLRIKQGYDPASVRQSMISDGWSEQIVNKVFQIQAPPEESVGEMFTKILRR